MSNENNASVSIKEITLSGVDFHESSIILTLLVTNPLPIPLSIKHLEFMVCECSTPTNPLILGRGELFDFKLTAKENILSIPAKLDNLSLLGTAANLLTNDLNVLIKGNVTFNLMFVAPMVTFEDKRTIRGLQSRILDIGDEK